MIVLLCSFILATGQPQCDMMEVNDALATMMTVNSMGWDNRRTMTPPTIFQTDSPPTGYRPSVGK